MPEPKILIVDDEEAARYGMARALKNYDVAEAGSVDEARRAKFLATIPLGRFSTALDVANAALYLASDEAAFISGVCIEVDGARCA